MRRLAPLLCICWLCACPPQPAVLEFAEPTIAPLTARGERRALALSARDEKGVPIEGPVASWSSASPEVASVENGEVVAHKSGVTVITARSGKAQVSREVVVAIPVSLEVVQGRSIIVAVGRSVYVSGLVRNERGAPIRDLPTEWTTDNPSVAVVEENRLKGMAPGYTRVTVHHGALSAPLEVRVVEADLSRLDLSPTRLFIDEVGQSRDFRAEMVDARGKVVPDVPLLWFTSNPSVATVDEAGRVTAHAVGKALISVTHGRFRSGADVVVKGPAR